MEDATDQIPPEYVPHALAVGALCNAWAMLEGRIRMLLIKASALPINRLSFGIVHCFDVRDSLAAIKLAVIDAKWSADVTSEAIACLNYIDSTLRVRRNRYVHDMWVYDDQAEEMNRFSYTPRTFKQQAFQPFDWSPLDISLDTPEDIWKTSHEIGAHGDQLQVMQDVFNRKTGAGEALLKARPPRQLPPLQSERPRPEGQ